ncbi:hypothetical protein DFJ74DRAFT_640817 [Hyaloraphidium curvatum]|nr:hypothetical protein DFJ74DRAFT_640817 [Hyaloraphidium curvatum]
MGKAKAAKRRLLRRSQSDRDREESFFDKGKQLSNPLREYREFLGDARSRGLPTGDAAFLGLPLLLVDLTSQIILALISGGQLSQGALGAPELPASPSSDPTGAMTFIRKVLRRAKMDVTSLVCAILFTQRLRDKGATLSDDPGATFLAALIVSDKYLADATYTNADWAEFSEHRYELEELNRLERDLLASLDYRLSITAEEYDTFLHQLDTLLSLQQISWDSLSYRDLVTLLQYPTVLGRHILLPAHMHGLPTLDAVMLLLKTLGGLASTYLSAVLVTAAVLSAFSHSSPSPSGPMKELLPLMQLSDAAAIIQEPYFVALPPQFGRYQSRMRSKVAVAPLAMSLHRASCKTHLLCQWDTNGNRTRLLHVA